MLSVKILPADRGDSILLSFGRNESQKNILIDGGTGTLCYRRLKQEFNMIAKKGQFIDLLIVTHTDDDHIAGILHLFQDTFVDKNIIKQVWFNSASVISTFFNTDIIQEREILLVPGGTTQISISQGRTLEKELKRYGCWSEEVILNTKVPCRIGDCQITVLSPNEQALQKLNRDWPVKITTQAMVSGHENDYDYSLSELLSRKFEEDNSPKNMSSIALLMQIGEKKILLLGDAFPSIVESSIRQLDYSEENKLKIDLMKVSHHGSKKNTSKSLLSLFECQNYVISTNGSRHGFPHKECLARIIDNQNGANLYFNYRFNGIFQEKDINEFEFSCTYLCDCEYRIDLEE